jgi:serine/threonine-protein kinase
MTMLSQLGSALADRYAIDREIGAGGMATVYLARDLRHDRPVAVKVLNPELAAVLGVERFLAEIRVTANLQHPNILPLFDSGEARPEGPNGSFLYYVMPYVDGETLRARLERERQLPVDEAVRIASAIGGALEYAHQHGVIHRDLKPENVLIQAGQPVVADFGIALAVSKAGGQRITQTGLSLGTPQYMSPEQATGDRAIDGRSDVYSLAALTYEMLSGEPPHTGSTAQAIIARVLTETPRPIRVARPAVPEHVEAAVARALEKLPADRFSTAREFVDALKWPGLAGGPGRARQVTAPSTRTVSSQSWQLLGAGAVTLASVAFGIWGWLRATPERPEPVVRSVVTLPDEARAEAQQPGTPLALSPDGSVLVYAGKQQLFVRRLDQTNVVPIPNTLGAQQPFFSPDGQHIGFVAGGALKRVPLAGGPVETICTVPQMQGATWGDGDEIVFASGLGVGGSLFKVSASGGTPELLFEDSTRKALYRWPDFLPGGTRVLVSIGAAYSYQAGIFDIRTRRFETIPGTASNPHYVESGSLLSVSAEGTVIATPFDVRAGRATGPAVPVLDGISLGLAGAAKLAVSRSGWAVYVEAATRQRHLTMVDRRGTPTPIAAEPQAYSDPRISPSGRDVVVTVLRPGGGLAGDLWVLNLARATLSRVTFEGSDQFPDWSSDGQRILYNTLTGANGVYWKPAGGGPSELLADSAGRMVYEAILTHDGKRVIYREGGIPGDLSFVHRDSLKVRHPLLASRFDERSPAISPDDRWLAYVSDETGRDEVYVRPFPDGGGRWVISAAGGIEPRWRRDGRELFYRNADTVIAVQVRTDSAFAVGERAALFTANYYKTGRHATYDVSPDGQRFIFISAAGDEASALMLVQNVVAAAKRRPENSKR